MKILNTIQQKLKAPKSQYNSFGKYSYRNCEDILEAVKPLLDNNVLIVSDEIVYIGNRYYVKATAELFDEAGVSLGKATALAREAEEQKGMNDAQITGSASSYARKYALNGLFLIDDTKDDDTREHTPKTAPKAKIEPSKPTLTLPQQISDAILRCKTISDLEAIAEKTKASEKLTDIQKENIMTEIEFMASELSINVLK